MSPTLRTGLLLGLLIGGIVGVFATALRYGERAVPQIAPTVAAVPMPEALAALPVLHRNRVKPFAIAAEETGWAITGKSRYGRQPDGTPANHAQLVLDVLRDGEAWRTRPLIAVPLIALRERLGMSGEFAAIEDLEAPEPLSLLNAGAVAKMRAHAAKEVVPVSAVEAAAAEVRERLELARELASGAVFELVPLLATAEQRAWAEGLGAQLGLATAGEARWRGRVRDLLAAITRATVAGSTREQAWTIPEAEVWIDLGSLAITPDPLLATWPDASGVSAAAQVWIAALRSRGDLAGPSTALAAAATAAAAEAPGWPTANHLRMELTFRRAAPFTWAWLACALGGTLAAIGLARRPITESRMPLLTRLGAALIGVGLLLISGGIAARVLISGYAAVTNLYETLLWVAAVAAVLGLVAALTTRNPIFVAAAGIAAALCAMVGEALPPDLGNHFGIMQPVLRTRFWLWLHVKVIVASYGAFLLAWVLANGALFSAARAGRAVAADSARAIYRTIQVGVVLCAAGTLLGGMWADETWGRFWGWDPKEVWALVILLVYLVPLHLRFAGAVGATGLAAWGVLGFLSVVMSWYGVNFLLGAGKHAYATGSGFAASYSTDQIIVLGLSLVQIVVTLSQMLLIRRAQLVR